MCIGAVGVVTEVDNASLTAKALVDGHERTVALIADRVTVGARVVIHTGFVIEVLDEEDRRWVAQPSVEA